MIDPACLFRLGAPWHIPIPLASQPRFVPYMAAEPLPCPLAARFNSSLRIHPCLFPPLPGFPFCLFLFHFSRSGLLLSALSHPPDLHLFPVPWRFFLIRPAPVRLFAFILLPFRVSCRSVSSLSGSRLPVFFAPLALIFILFSYGCRRPASLHSSRSRYIGGGGKNASAKKSLPAGQSAVGSVLDAGLSESPRLETLNGENPGVECLQMDGISGYDLQLGAKYFLKFLNNLYICK